MGFVHLLDNHGLIIFNLTVAKNTKADLSKEAGNIYSLGYPCDRKTYQ